MATLRKPLCDEIEEQEFKVLALLDSVAAEQSMTLKQIVVALDQLRQRAADLQTANDLRAGLIARQRGSEQSARGLGDGADHASNW